MRDSFHCCQPLHRPIAGCRVPTPIPDRPLPTPIPQLDSNGNHNVPPAPYVEPSEIYNFRGQVATAVLLGRGRSQLGQALRFGGPGTDVRFMSGEYVADGIRTHGTFVHL